jgi:hypothetical protein
MRKTQGKGSRKTYDPELRGAVPRLTTVQDLAGANPWPEGRRISGNRTNRGKSKVPKVNLKAVADALLDEGLDPATEIARVLKGRPMVDAEGNPVIDALTGEPVMQHLVEPEVRLRTLNSLLEFVQPKLKSVELSGKNGGPIAITTISPDQAERIAREFLARHADD